MTRHTLDAGDHRLFLNSSSKIPDEVVDKFIKTLSLWVFGVLFVLTFISLVRCSTGV